MPKVRRKYEKGLKGENKNKAKAIITKTTKLARLGPKRYIVTEFDVASRKTIIVNLEQYWLYETDTGTASELEGNETFSLT